MIANPGTMNAAPPTTAPIGPATDHADKIASWVDAGPGNRLHAATASSNSEESSHSLRSTQRSRSNAMCVGGAAEANASNPPPLHQHLAQTGPMPAHNSSSHRLEARARLTPGCGNRCTGPTRHARLRVALTPPDVARPGSAIAVSAPSSSALAIAAGRTRIQSPSAGVECVRGEELHVGRQAVEPNHARRASVSGFRDRRARSLRHARCDRSDAAPGNVRCRPEGSCSFNGDRTASRPVRTSVDGGRSACCA